MSCKVKDGLFMGGADAAQDAEFIQLNGIQYIINCCAQELPCLFELDGVNYMRIRLPSMPSNDFEFFDVSNRSLTDAFMYIDKALNAYHSVLVHSLNGTSRSACVVIAYLMHKYKWGVDKTFEYLVLKKNDLEPNAKYVEQLYNYESQLVNETHDMISIAKLNHWDLNACDADTDESMLISTYLNSITHTESEMLKKQRRCSHSRKLVWIDEYMADNETTLERPPSASYNALVEGDGWKRIEDDEWPGKAKRKLKPMDKVLIINDSCTFLPPPNNNEEEREKDEHDEHDEQQEREEEKETELDHPENNDPEVVMYEVENVCRTAKEEEQINDKVKHKSGEFAKENTIWATSLAEEREQRAEEREQRAEDKHIKNVTMKQKEEEKKEQQDEEEEEQEQQESYPERHDEDTSVDRKIQTFISGMSKKKTVEVEYDERIEEERVKPVEVQKNPSSTLPRYLQPTLSSQYAQRAMKIAKPMIPKKSSSQRQRSRNNSFTVIQETNNMAPVDTKSRRNSYSSLEQYGVKSKEEHREPRDTKERNQSNGISHHKNSSLSQLPAIEQSKCKSSKKGHSSSHIHISENNQSKSSTVREESMKGKSTNMKSMSMKSMSMKSMSTKPMAGVSAVKQRSVAWR